MGRKRRYTEPAKRRSITLPERVWEWLESQDKDVNLVLLRILEKEMGSVKPSLLEVIDGLRARVEKMKNELYKDNDSK